MSEEDFSPQAEETSAALVYAEFTDAYSFRNLVEYLNLTNTDGNFIFTPKEILYERAHDTNHIFNKIIIHSHELTDYIYNADEESVMVGVNLTHFKGITKKIGKKDIARLIVFPSSICLQIIGSPKSSCNDDMDIIRTQRLEHVEYSNEGYQEDDEPNCVVSIQKFTTACSDVAACKDEFVTIIGVESAIKLEANQGGNLRKTFRTLGNSEEFTNNERIIKNSDTKSVKLVINNPNEIVNYKIPRRIISSLNKLTNISPNGTVKIYLQPKLPIKLIFHISTYGTLTVYLRS